VNLGSTLHPFTPLFVLVRFSFHFSFKTAIQIIAFIFPKNRLILLTDTNSTVGHQMDCCFHTSLSCTIIFNCANTKTNNSVSAKQTHSKQFLNISITQGFLNGPEQWLCNALIKDKKIILKIEE